MSKNVVVVGGGFAGMNVARAIEQQMPAEAANIVLVNDTNHILYAPLLPEAASGTLEPRHVVTPLRDILHRTDIRLGAVSSHQPKDKTVVVTDHDGESTLLPYEHLVFAVGAVSRSLPIPGLEQHAIGFKSLADAIWLRNRVIQTLESANATKDPQRRKELLTYVVVGAGYSGIEALAELQDYAAHAISQYPNAQQTGMQWVLIEAGEQILPDLGNSIAKWTLQQLRHRGIEVHLGARLSKLDGHSVHWTAPDGSDHSVDTKTAIWTAGVTAHPCLRRMNLPLDPGGRVIVDNTMQVAGQPGVWALGDCAAVPEVRGGFCPPTAQHAIRQGKLVGSNILAVLQGSPAKPFLYKSPGVFMNLGRYQGAAKIGPLRFSGKFAWWLTRTYHLAQIPGAGRKLRAIMDWTMTIPFKPDTAEVGTIGTPRPLNDTVYQYGGSHRPLENGVDEPTTET